MTRMLGADLWRNPLDCRPGADEHSRMQGWDTDAGQFPYRSFARVVAWLAVGALMAAMGMLAVLRSPLSPAPASTGVWATSAEIGDFVQRRADELHLSGVAVVVLRDGDVYHESYLGTADGSHPVTGSTPFILGSTSKQFTGLAIQSLINDRRLSVDARIVDLLPAFATADGDGTGITVRDLLAQTSGLSTTTGLEQWGWRPGRPDSISANADALADARLVRAPGTAFEYSNANYDLLGAIVEQVTGEPFEQAFHRLVAAPLGLDHTTARPEVSGDTADGFYPWLQFATLRTPSPNTPGAVASAFVVSTADDLTQLVKAHLGSVTTAVPAEVLAHSRVPLSAENEYVQYASGWGVRRLWELSPIPGELLDGVDLDRLPSCVEHFGDTDRSQSHLLACPTEGIGLVALTNTGAGTDTWAWSQFQSDLTHVILGTPAQKFEVSIVESNAPFLLLGTLVVQGATVLLLFSRGGGRRHAVSIIAAIVAAAALVAAWGWLPFESGSRIPLPALWANVPDVAVTTALSSVLAAVCFTTLAVRTGRRYLGPVS